MNDVLGKIVFLCVVFILCSSSVFAISETDEHYDRLVSRAEFKNLDSYTVNLIQENLAVIYQHDLNWSRDVRLSQRPLTDGVVGPVTLFWLQRFITDFKIEPIGNFVSQVNIRLERIASFANMFPEETSILLSADFAHWNDKQLNLQRESYYRIRQSGSDQELLDLVYRYLQVSDPQSNVMGDGSELTIYYYQLDTEDFKILRSKDLITQQLATLENIRYDNVAMLSAAVSDVLGDFPEQIKKILPFIQRYYLQSDPVVTKNFIVALTKQMLGDPRYSALNSTLAVLLEKELADITYPDKNLFDKAAQAKIRAGIGACYPPKQHNQHILSLRLGDEEFEQLSNELLTGMYYQGMPNIRQQLAEIKRLRLKKSADCGASERGMVKSFVADLYNNNVQPAIAVLYKKTPEFDPKNSIQWYGGGCGCVLDELSGTVYGFYPFWLANKTGEQKVNFSVLSRVAYYGLSFDDKGNIQQANNNYKASILSEDGRVKSEMSEFIQVAHRHNSKVDWVIQNDKPYWDSWKSITFGTRAIIFESLEDNIINLLTNPLLSGLTQLKQTLTGGMLSPPTQGNGVSLYFNDYPDDPDSITLFSNFVDNLKNKLKIVDDDYFINIMVPQSAFGEGFYSYENLLGLISNPVENERLLGGKKAHENIALKILVLIEEPTTDSKKELRSQVENGGLNGEKRRFLLRNIIPVITFDGKNWEQLEDDLAYFKDNFGGVGFWPLTIEPNDALSDESGGASDSGAKSKEDDSDKVQASEITKTVSNYLVRYFQNENRSGKPDSWLDEFVCENRDFFRIALSLLTLLSLYLLWFYFKSCCARGKAGKYYVYGLFVTVTLALVVALLLLLYDPVLEKLSKGNVPLIAVMFICLAMTLIGYQRRKRQVKKPTRPRILATHRTT